MHLSMNSDYFIFLSSKIKRTKPGTYCTNVNNIFLKQPKAEFFLNMYLKGGVWNFAQIIYSILDKKSDRLFLSNCSSLAYVNY